MNLVSSHRYNWSHKFHHRICVFKGQYNKILCPNTCSPPNSSSVFRGEQQLVTTSSRRAKKYWQIFSTAENEGLDPDDSGEEPGEDGSPDDGSAGVNNEILKENLERIIGSDDSAFSGFDLATLIRNKYGRSYDIQLIKKEFMGKNLLALNVMWKYLEQRSFPLTEEEYILRLDDVANTLKCWGAVSHIRSSLAKSKERPRIGKAVSIFIDMDESGGRANEWIYK